MNRSSDVALTKVTQSSHDHFARAAVLAAMSMVLVAVGLVAATPAYGVTGGYKWQGEVTFNLDTSYWIPLRANLTHVGKNYPVVYVGVTDSCWVTAQFLPNGQVQSVPRAFQIGADSPIDYASGAAVDFYGTTWNGNEYVRVNRPFFRMAETPSQVVAKTTGTLTTTYPPSRGTDVSMSPTFSFGADEHWTPDPTGSPHVNTEYCRPTPGPGGTYYLPTARYTPQNWPLWYDIWPSSSQAYPVKVTSSERFEQLPDGSLLNAAQRALEQAVNAQYVTFKYDASKIIDTNPTPTIGQEVIQFGSMNSVFNQPWNMCYANC